MIKGLMGEKGIVVGSGNTSVPYVNQNQSNPMQGVVRVWGTDMQVFDGSAWVGMTTRLCHCEFGSRNTGLDPMGQGTTPNGLE